METEKVQQPTLPSSPDNIKVARVKETVTKNGKEESWFWTIDPVDATFASNIIKKKGNDNRIISFYCPVCDSETGEYCNAELFLDEHSNKFKTKYGALHKHIFSAENIRISPEIIYNPRSFLEFLLAEKKREKKDINIKVYKDPFDVPYSEAELIQPRNLEEFYIQTRHVDMEASLPDNPDGSKWHYRVEECFLNRDTFISFRTGFFQFAIPVLVIAEAVDENDKHYESLRQSEPDTEKQIIVLKDPFPVGDGTEEDRLYFVITCDKNPCVAGKKYLLLCEWSLMTQTYIEEIDIKLKVVRGTIEKSGSQIKLIDESLFQRFEGRDYSSVSIFEM